jgi:hypothetical protein
MGDPLGHDDSEEARAQRAAARSKRITVRKFSSFEEAEAADDEFWAAMTAAERFAATCEMGIEWEAWNGGSGVEPRLARSVESIQRP